MYSLKGVVWSLHLPRLLLPLHGFVTRWQDEALGRPVLSYNSQKGVHFACEWQQKQRLDPAVPATLDFLPTVFSPQIHGLIDPTQVQFRTR